MNDPPQNEEYDENGLPSGAAAGNDDDPEQNVDEPSSDRTDPPSDPRGRRERRVSDTDETFQAQDPCPHRRKWSCKPNNQAQDAERWSGSVCSSLATYLTTQETW